MAAIETLATMLRAAGLTVFDTEVHTTPSGPYVIVSDRDPGLAEPHRQSPTPHWTRMTFDVRMVSRTIPGTRDLITRVRAALTGKRLGPDGPLLRELEGSPLMTTGPLNDQRHETVLAYRAQTLTEGAFLP